MPAVALPHLQPATKESVITLALKVVAPLLGSRVSVLVEPVIWAMFCTVTEITPVAEVVIVATYLVDPVVLAVKTSQPQPFVPTVAVDALDW